MAMGDALNEAIDTLAKSLGWECLSDYAFEHEMAEDAILYTRGDEHIKTRVDMLRHVLGVMDTPTLSIGIDGEDFEVPEEVYIEFMKLKNEIKNLKQKDIERSWIENPDRSGGQFTNEEINRPDRL